VIPWLIAILSTIVCLILWFRDVRRIMRTRGSTVESAARQLAVCRKRLTEAPGDPELKEVLARSESIYQQGVDLYNQTLDKLFFRLPGKMLGFYPIQREEYLLEMDDPRNDASPSNVEADKQPYFGSVRFFKNLILLAVIIMIMIPTVFAFRFSSGLRRSEKILMETEGETDGLRQEIENLTAREETLRKTLEEAEKAHLKKTAVLESEMQRIIEEQQKREEAEAWAEPPYAGLYPDFYAPQELQANVRESGVIYLTFDDGPSERTTEILDILKEKNVKATFFVVGSKDEYQKDLLRRIVEEGHTLGMHSYSHVYSKIYASVEDYLADMYQIFNQIKEETGVPPTLFRFPGGSINGYNSAIYQELVAEMMRRGFVPFDWNISNGDASEKPVAVDTLVTNVISGARNVERGVALMHDSAPRVTTVQALETIIEELWDMGFELKALTPDAMPLLYAYQN